MTHDSSIQEGHETSAGIPRIVIIRDGPYLLDGSIPLVDPLGVPVAATAPDGGGCAIQRPVHVPLRRLAMNRARSKQIRHCQARTKPFASKIIFVRWIATRCCSPSTCGRRRTCSSTESKFCLGYVPARCHAMAHGPRRRLRSSNAGLPVERPTPLLATDHGPFWRTSTSAPPLDSTINGHRRASCSCPLLSAGAAYPRRDDANRVLRRALHGVGRPDLLRRTCLRPCSRVPARAKHVKSVS
jgi:hypothetical protein